MKKGPKPIPIIDRLRRSIAIDENGCWIWTLARASNGYGLIGRGGHYGLKALVHRVAYEELVGPIPKGLTIDHLCRVRACCNPEHLEPVSMRENLMRGETLTARKAQQTHCIHGHAFDAVNTARRPNGTRSCRTCGAERARRKKAVA